MNLFACVHAVIEFVCLDVLFFQSGVYEKPEWLSESSIEMLDQLLQVDPKRRITVTQLLFHPWVLKDCNPGYAVQVFECKTFHDRGIFYIILNPFSCACVQWESVYQTQELDDECVTEMAVSVGKSRKMMYKMLAEWPYDYNTATYLLLWQRKQQSKSVRLSIRDQQVSRWRGSTFYFILKFKLSRREKIKHLSLFHMYRVFLERPSRV